MVSHLKLNKQEQDFLVTTYIKLKEKKLLTKNLVNYFNKTFPDKNATYRQLVYSYKQLNDNISLNKVR